MAWTEAQRAALARVGHNFDQDEEEQGSGFTPEQQAALDRAKARATAAQTYTDAYGNVYTDTPRTPAPTNDRGRLSKIWDQAEARTIANSQQLAREAGIAAERGGLGQTVERVGDAFDSTFLTNSKGEANLLGRAANWARQRATERDGVPRGLVGGPDVSSEDRAAAMAALGPGEIETAARRRADEYEREGFAPKRVTEIRGLASGLQVAGENLVASGPQMAANIAAGPLRTLLNPSIYGGEINEEILNKVGAENVSDSTRVLLSLGGGSLMGALDQLGITSALEGLGRRELAELAATKGLSKLLVSKGVPQTVANVAETAVVEFGTEMAQEGVIMGAAGVAGAKYTPGEVAGRLLEAGATGGLVGAGMRGSTEIAGAVVGNKPSESGTDLDAETADQVAQENAALGRQADAAAQAEQAKVDAEVRATKENRDRFARTFMPEADFIKQRTATRAQQVLDPNTEIGAEFREWRLENDIYPANDTEQKKAASDFLKAFIPASDRDAARAEYIAALDAHAAKMQELEQSLNPTPTPAPEAAPAPAPEVADDTQVGAPFTGELSYEEYNALPREEKLRYLNEVGLAPPPPPPPLTAEATPAPEAEAQPANTSAGLAEATAAEAANSETDTSAAESTATETVPAAPRTPVDIAAEIIEARGVTLDQAARENLANEIAVAAAMEPEARSAALSTLVAKYTAPKQTKKPNAAPKAEKPAPTPKAAQNNVQPEAAPTQETATEAAPTKEAPAKPKKLTKKEQWRQTIEEQLGPDWEINHPSLSQGVEKSANLYSRGEGKKPRIETLLEEAVREEIIAKAEAEEAKGNRVALDVEAIPAAETKAKKTILKRSELRADAEAAFGKDALENDTEYKDVKDALNNTKMKLADVKAIIDAKKPTSEPKQEAPKTDELTKALKEIRDAETANKAESASARLVSQLFSPVVEAKAKLKGNEAKVWRVLRDNYTAGTDSTVVDQSGNYINSEIAKVAGLKGENATKAVNGYISRAIKKIAEVQGVTPEQMVGALGAINTVRRDRADLVVSEAADTDAAGLLGDIDAVDNAADAAAAAADLDEANMFDALDNADVAGDAANMTIVDSANKSTIANESELTSTRNIAGVRQYAEHLRTGKPLPKVKEGQKKSEVLPSASLTSAQKNEIKQFVKAGMTDAQLEAFYTEDTSAADTDSEIMSPAEEKAETVQVDFVDRVVKDQREAFAAQWRRFSTTDDPDFNELTPAEQRAWAEAVIDFLQDRGRSDRFTNIERAFDEIVRDFAPAKEKASGQETKQGNDTGARDQTDEASKRDSAPNSEKETGTGAQAVASDGAPSPVSGQETEVTQTPKKPPVVETRKKKQIVTPQTQRQMRDAAVADAKAMSDADPTPKELRNQKSFKESYAEKEGINSALWSNPDLTEAAQLADWLGSLTQEQWDKINPAFTNNLNPFKNPASIDFEADKAKLEAKLNEGGPNQKPSYGFSPDADPYADMDPLAFASPESMANVVEDLTGKRSHPRIHVYESEADLIADVESGVLPPVDVSELKKNKPFGYVVRDRKGESHAHFITSRIPAGQELAAFMHEVGGHIGVDRWLSPENKIAMVSRIREWATNADGSLEHKVAKEAMLNFSSGRLSGFYADTDMESEVIAYFLEGAAAYGVTPTVQTPIGRLVRDLYAAFKRAVRKLNLFDADKITMQNMVDAAYGAARIDLSTSKHGSGVDFRRFNHNYMGTGEGAQAFGFGTYLAENFGIARGYLRAMEKNAAQRTRRNDKPKLPVESVKTVAEKLRTPGVRLKNGFGEPFQKPAYDGDLYLGERDLVLDRDLGRILSKNAVVRRIGRNTLVVDAATPDANFPPLPLSDLLHPTENRQLFSQQELDGIQRELEKVEYPDGVPTGSLMRVDTTVSDNELSDWYANWEDDPAFSRAMDNLTDEAYTLLMASIEPQRNRNDLFDDPSKSVSVGAIYAGLANSNVANKLKADLSPEALSFVESIPNRFMSNAAAVSAWLDQNGVKGFKYADAATRDRYIIDPQADDITYNRVIFNDKNLIVAAASPGTAVSDTENTVSEVRYGANSLTQRAQAQQNWVEQNFGGPKTAQFMGNARTIFQRPLDSTKFLSRYIRDVRDEMPSAKTWYDKMLEAEQTYNEIIGKVEGLAIRAREFAPERTTLINDFLATSTFFQKWGYDPQIKGKKVKIDPIMKQKFDRLTPEEQQVVKDIFQHGEDVRQMMSDIAKQLGVSKLFAFDSKLEGPYAPLKRFGNYVAVLKSQDLLDAEANFRAQNNKINGDKVEKLKSDAQHYVVSFFDTQGAANKFAKANEKKYAYTEASEKFEDQTGPREASPKVYQKVMAALKADEKAGLDKRAKASLETLIKDLYFQSLEESNARLSGARRMNRAGFDKDMIRSFVSHGRSQARLISQMKHGAEINEALINARKEASKRPSALSPVYNTLVAKYQNVMTSRTGMLSKLADNILAFNTVYMLTTSLGYHITNATQPIISVGKIAGEMGNHIKVWGSLIRGYKVGSSVIDTSFMRQLGTAATMGFVDMNNKITIDTDKAPPKYRQLLKTLQLRQLLDVGMEEDLNIENRFDTGYESLNKFTGAFRNMTHRLYQIARFVEANNRISSAVAAYDAALANPQKARRLYNMSPEEYAISVVEDTQGNFSKMDAPLLIDNLPRVTTQFRKYQLMMAWLHASAFKQAFRGESREAKIAGARTSAFLLGYTGAMAGAVGIPAANFVAWAFLSMTGDEEEPENLERWVREELFPDNEGMADLITRGVPAFFGVDMSTKLSQSDIFQPYNSNFVRPEATPDGMLNFVASVGLGPTASTVRNFGNMLEFLSKGEPFRAAEYAAPRGIRSVMESYRYSQDGYTLRNGDVVADPREFDMFDLLSNALNLPSTEINKIKWTRGQQYELEQWFSKETGRLNREYIQANRSRDREKMAELRQEWRDLQKAKDRVRPFFNNAPSALRRQPVTNLLRAPRRQATSERRVQDMMGY